MCNGDNTGQATIDIEQEYLSPQEVAEKMHVTPHTVRNLFHRGKIEGTRFGSQIRLVKRSVDLYLQTQQQVL